METRFGGSNGDAQSSGVKYTTDNGSTVLSAAAFGVTTGAPTRILAHPTNSSAAFVTFSGYGNVAHVLRTTNLGASWQNLTGNLLEEPVNCIAVNPSNPNQMFVGTDSGVWLGTEGEQGVSWLPYGEDLPHAYIFDLEIQNARQRLVAATHGRAAWDIDILEAALY